VAGAFWRGGGYYRLWSMERACMRVCFLYAFRVYNLHACHAYTLLSLIGIYFNKTADDPKDYLVDHSTM
jgi:hypothetical protein